VGAASAYQIEYQRFEIVIRIVSRGEKNVLLSFREQRISVFVKPTASA